MVISTLIVCAKLQDSDFMDRLQFEAFCFNLPNFKIRGNTYVDY